MHRHWVEDAPLFRAWRHFVESEAAPFTIPGHKRLAAELDPAMGRLLDADVPLYGGLDDVKLTAGVLADAERRAAQLWGADWCRFSTGGSTHANQAVCLALGRPGDTVIVSRTAHRSTLLGLVVAGLVPVWVPPVLDARTGVPTGMNLAALHAALTSHRDAAAVLCVEPSYLGASSDLGAIVALAHDRDVPVVVDQAWGAHLGFAPGYPDHALAGDADVLVTSAHKALPAFSQAALVLARTTRLDRDRLERGFEAAHTTSPAGAILASIDAARAILAAPDGRDLLIALAAAVGRIRRTLADHGVATVSPGDFPAGRFDPAKLVILTGPSGHSGLDIETRLIGQGVPVEMADLDTVVPMVTMADSAGSLDRLEDALVAALAGPVGAGRTPVPSRAWSHSAPQVMTPRDAFFATSRSVPFDQAVGKVSAETVAPYPPGVPVLVPGEQITDATLETLRAADAAGTRIAYATDPTLRTLQVVVDDSIRSVSR